MSREEPSQDFPTQPSKTDPPRKRPASERRIQANRRNALRSTGPKPVPHTPLKPFMSGRILSLWKRLARVEQILSNLVEHEQLANCTCRKSTVAYAAKPEEFQAEMNRTCPAHGFRSLGMIVHVDTVGRASPKLTQLLETYRARKTSGKLRLSLLRQVGRELKRESTES
jgi:hypothetical protein